MPRPQQSPAGPEPSHGADEEGEAPIDHDSDVADDAAWVKVDKDR